MQKPKRYIVIMHGIMAVLGLSALGLEVFRGDLLSLSALKVLQIFTFVGWPVVFCLDLRAYLKDRNEQKDDAQP